MAGKYDDLTHAQLVELLEKRDRTKKLGLVWERDEIEADAAVDANFIACRIDEALSDKPAPWDNLVIEGDNFDALRWLRMTHAGRVKCITSTRPTTPATRIGSITTATWTRRTGSDSPHGWSFCIAA